jgi:hypothetical protein
MSQAEPDPEDLEILALLNTERRPGTTLNGRRAREARPLSHADRRLLSADHIKDKQMNLTVSTAFRQHVQSLAAAEGLSMVGLIEKSVAFYSEQKLARSP